jgi:hypothetical protein
MRISENHVPTFLKKRELRRLFEMTASAFGHTVPSTAGLSFDECLTAFAQYAETEVAESIDRGEDLQATRDRLYNRAFEFGERFRRRFRVSTRTEVMEASRILYHFLGIDFRETSPGKITIGACFFSKYYSARTCWVMSSLDEGMMAGLSGGGMLTFSQRITEGCDSCKADFT